MMHGQKKITKESLLANCRAFCC